MNVSEILTNKFESVDIKADLQEVLPLFKNSNNATVLVYDGKEYVGMLTEKTIVHSLRNLKTGVNGLVKKTPKITPETSIYEAARLMVENQLKQLPVFDKKVIGVVTNESLMNKAIQTDFGKRPVSTLMSEDVILIDADETIGKLTKVIREEGISRLPVLSNGKLVGIVTMHDLLKIIKPTKTDYSNGSIGIESSPLRDLTIKELMTESVITIKPEALVIDAVKLMVDRDIQGLVVFDGKVKGVITRTDVLLGLAAIEKKTMGDSFTIQMSNGNLVDLDPEFVKSSTLSFVKKFEKFLGRGTINVDFKQYKESFRGNPLVLCRIRLKTDKHFYYAKGENWGADGAFHLAISNMERQVLDDKEIREDRRYVDTRMVEDLELL